MEEAEPVEYNDYAQTSSFFGPGGLAAWYLLMLSVTTTWIFSASHQFRVTGDFLAAMMYAGFAVGYLVLEVVRYPSDQLDYLVANLMNLICDDVCGAATPGPVTESGYGTGKPVLALDGGERAEVYPRVVAMNAALRVMDTMSFMCLSALVILLVYGFARRRRATLYMLLAGLLWSWTARLALCVRIWSHGGSRLFSLTFMQWCMAYVLAGLDFMLVILLVAIVVDVYEKVGARIRNRSHYSIYTEWSLSMAFWFVVWLVLATAGTYVSFPRSLFFPPTGYSLSELDQMAALAGGLVTLLFTVYSLVKQNLEETSAAANEAARQQRLWDLEMMAAVCLGLFP